MPTWNLKQADIVFDPRLDIECNYLHVFKSNESRIKKCFGELERKNVPVPFSTESWFMSQLGLQLTRAKYNCRLAIPQIFNEEDLQLLLPFYQNDQVVLVITLRKEKRSDKECYIVNTILEPMWAYNNARVLCPVEYSWLSTIIPDIEANNGNGDDDDDSETSSLESDMGSVNLEDSDLTE